MRSALTVIEVGPATVRGGRPVDDETAREAIEFIDEELMLVDDRPLAVEEVWEGLLRTATGGRAAALVVPTGWGGRRVDVVADAARHVCGDIAVFTRSEVLGVSAASVVEIDCDVVIVTSGGVTAVPRSGGGTVDAVVRRIGGRGPVVVDAPTGVADAVPQATAIVTALRTAGVQASIAGPHAVRHGVPVPRPAPRRTPRRIAVAAGAVCAVATAGAAGVAGRPEPPVAEPSAVFVEGRLGVALPVTWTVRKITAGSGSARLQVVSPVGDSVALHVTQSPLPRPQSTGQIATTLRAALAAESAEVFTDFLAEDERAGRQVVTYREHRAGAVIEWIVFADELLRIAVGCQSPPDRTDLVRTACDAAVRSAHAVF
ncbi:type VII secretion-associated protein [Mycobacterium sp. 852013-51886_SCH5428379]|uniref:type VII secretion-associated protein n=1 Tax=Mycobacterium sp. 852013-51886_SCH5428379 TaxID=1834111 RepID=UPI001E4C362F|nr:type VII secretion-associated protein [Mycobacterium sp. 852013-51886_SCH5428379]